MDEENDQQVKEVHPCLDEETDQKVRGVHPCFDMQMLMATYHMLDKLVLRLLNSQRNRRLGICRGEK